jgi:hypothetical protein
MDESELEARLRRRLHQRFDGSRASDGLRDAVVASLAGQPPAARRRLTPGTMFAGSRQLLAVAAVIVIVVVATIAIFGREGSVGSPLPSASPSATPSSLPSASPSGSAQASGSVTASASANPTGPVGSVPPISRTAWSGLDLHQLAGAPELAMVVPWSGGYVAITGSSSSALAGASISRDGRAWVQLPTATFGLDDPTHNTFVIGGTACGSGVLIVGKDGSGNGTLWFSADGQVWRQEALPGGIISQVRGAFIAGSPAGAVVANESGPAVDVTTDCSSWRRVTLSGPATAQITAVAAVGTGYVALDDSSQAPASEPRAWWSSDGVTWSAATVQAAPGHDFNLVWVGAGGLVAQSHSGGAPGAAAVWSSVDGHAWAISPKSDPLGVSVSGEGQGNPAGSLAGDGTRFLAWGSQGDDPANPTEYLTSSDGAHWTQLAITGHLPTGLPGAYQVFLVRDGILVSGDAGTWFGAAVTK